MLDIFEYEYVELKQVWFSDCIFYEFLQAELKQKVENYKKERKDEEKFLEEQKKVWEEEEKERHRQISAREIHRFRDRVS